MSSFASTWDAQQKSPNMRLLGDSTQVTNAGEDEKWQAVRGSKKFSTGKNWFEFVVTRHSQTANTWKFCLGVCPETFDCNHQKKWCGSQGSWAYIAGTGGICHDGANSIAYGCPLVENDVLRVLLDFDEGTISFCRNGVCYGVAFTNLRDPVYACASFTGKGSVLQLRVPASVPYPLTSNIVGDDIVDWDCSSGWDQLNMSECLSLENNKSNCVVKNNGSDDKWQCCRSKSVFASGRCYFEMHIFTDAKTTNTWRFCVGVVPVYFDVKSKQKKWVGSQGSWGFAAVGETCHDAASGVKYGTRFGQDDVVGCLLDFDALTIEYFVNGRSQGIAFRNLRGPVHAALSFTGTGSRVYLRVRKSIMPVSAYNAVSVAPAISESRPRPVASSGSPDALCWDSTNSSTYLSLDSRSPSIVRNSGSSDKWQCVTSKQTFSSGVVSIEIEVLLPKVNSSNTWSFCVGAVPITFSASANQKWVGSQGSWGYIAGTGGVVHDGVESIPYHQTYTHGDVITMTLDFNAKTISFAKNGTCPGVAFRNLSGPVRAAVSLTPTNAQVQIRWPASVAQSMAEAQKSVSVAEVSLVAVDANVRRSIEVESEYFGLMFAITEKQKIVADDIRIIQKFSAARSISTDLHNKVLGKLGMTSEKFESMKRLNEEGPKEEDLCVICMDQAPNAVFRPCGHLKVCLACTNGLKECPMCRASIQEVIKVFR